MPKSENSRAGSEGQGESGLSSYESSPRKGAELVVTGPCGDHSPTKHVQPACIVYQVNDSINSKSDSEEDVAGWDLKLEYLQRINTIREKLASIDIANKNYYNNCFGFPPLPENQCIITEIVDDDIESKSLKTNIENDIKEDNIIVDNEIRKNNIADSMGTDKNLQQESSNQVFMEDMPRTCNSAITENIQTVKECDWEIKSIIKNESFFNSESSSLELLELNYNPPKKKPCVRENTPKVIQSEDDLPLPYHIKVSLHKDICNARKKSILCNEKDNKNNIKADKNTEDKYVFPEIKIQDFDGEIRNTHIYMEDLYADDNPSSAGKSMENENLYIAFLDAIKQSQSGSPRSNKTIFTETTITIDSPRKPKKRRLVLRSAKNKVKPVDKITLWEEIRTLEALNKKTHYRRSSSKESFFQNIILNRVEEDKNLDMGSLCSLEVPPKETGAAKFPSITKITRFWSSMCSKKSEPNLEKSKTIETVPKVANVLMDIKQEQDFYIDDEGYTPTDEMCSDYSNPSNEDIDDLYAPTCFFCFCF